MRNEEKKQSEKYPLKNLVKSNVNEFPDFVIAVTKERKQEAAMNQKTTPKEAHPLHSDAAPSRGKFDHTT